jgi:uncharacterized membrane protein
MEEKKPNNTGAIIGTIAAILLCGLPGLCLLCPIGVAAIAGMVNYSNVGFDLTPGYGVAFLCMAVIFIVIAIIVPVLLLRKKKVTPEAAPVDILPPQEPLPPAS